VACSAITCDTAVPVRLWLASLPEQAVTSVDPPKRCRIISLSADLKKKVSPFNQLDL